MYDFPRLHQFTCFPALATVFVFSRACNRLRAFPRLTQVACPSDSTSDWFLVICIHSDWSDIATPKPRGLFQRKDKSHESLDKPSPLQNNIHMLQLCFISMLYLWVPTSWRYFSPSSGPISTSFESENKIESKLFLSFSYNRKLDAIQTNVLKTIVTLDSKAPLRGIITAPLSLVSTHSFIFASLKN